MPRVPLIKLSDPDLALDAITVKNSGLIKLQTFSDEPDGDLTIGEVGKQIPFKIKRFYFTNRLHHPGAIRGKHTHYKAQQIIICLSGYFTLHLDDGKSQQVIIMDNHTWAVKLGPMLWHEMTGFSRNCTILTVSDSLYEEADYIREYQKFLKILKQNGRQKNSL